MLIFKQGIYKIHETSSQYSPQANNDSYHSLSIFQFLPINQTLDIKKHENKTYASDDPIPKIMNFSMFQW